MKSSVLAAWPARFRQGERCRRLLYGVSLSLFMIGCTPAATATPAPTLAPQANIPLQAGNVQASAEVVPAQEAYLGFVISGALQDVTVKKGDPVEAGQLLATLRSPDLEYRVLQAEASVRAAELDYEYWKLPRRVAGEVVERGPVAQQELEVARRSLETSQAELAQTRLAAPFAATVVSVEVQPGEFVRPGQAVIVLAKLDTLQIETTDLSELNVATVRTGQPAVVYVEALDQELNGVVTAISPIANTLGSEVVFKVTIRLEEQPRDLLWGMSADVEIETE